MKMRSLSGRVALLLGLATVVVLGAAAVVMDHMVDAEMQQRFDSGLLTRARTLASLFDLGPEGLALEKEQEPAQHVFSGHVPMRWTVRCTDGSRQASQPPPQALPPAWVQRAGKTPAYADVKAEGQLFRAVWFRFRPGPPEDDDAAAAVVATPAGSNVCTLVFLRSRKVLDDILTDIDGILLVTPMLALLLVLLISPWLVRQGLKPLAMLGESMREIGPQAAGNRLPSTGRKELEPLVARFNEVLARMDEGMARERDFAGAIAHETRTRLAELKTLADVELRYPSDRSRRELLQEVGQISGELENVVSGLLMLTRLDAGIEALRMTHLDMAAVLAQHIKHLAPISRRRGLQVENATHDAHAPLVADPALLDIIVGNVLGNAFAHAPQDSVVRIRLDRDALKVGNLAPGLEAEEVERFGQRFWSKHHGIEGHAGLGLALAGAAAQAMHFSLTFRLDSGQLQVRLEWPGSSSEPVHETDAETAG